MLVSRFGSDTGSRGSSPWDFTGKTGFFLTFLHVELTNMQSAQILDRFFFARLKGEFNPHFRGFLGQTGTNPRETMVLQTLKGTQSCACEPGSILSPTKKAPKQGDLACRCGEVAAGFSQVRC